MLLHLFESCICVLQEVLHKIYSTIVAGRNFEIEGDRQYCVQLLTKTEHLYGTKSQNMAHTSFVSLGKEEKPFSFKSVCVPNFLESSSNEFL